MLKLLFLPGALFLLVIVFRVIIPFISTAPWKRMLDNARYYRHRKDFIKSDKLLQKAVEKFPDRAEVYLEYFLNHSESGNLKKRFDVIMDGYKKTSDTVLCFFIASTYLEHGLYEKAEEYLNTVECRDYMLQKGISLLPELYFEKGDYTKAEYEYEEFYRQLYNSDEDFSKILKDFSPQDLILLALIKKESGGDYRSIMDLAPKSSIHSNMAWQDLLKIFNDKLSEIKPATIGITGDPGDFNRKRKEYFNRRIRLIEAYL